MICNKYTEDAILKVPLIYLKALKSNGEYLPECFKPRAASDHILARRPSIAEGWARSWLCCLARIRAQHIFWAAELLRGSSGEKVRSWEMLPAISGPSPLTV